MKHPTRSGVFSDGNAPFQTLLGRMVGEPAVYVQGLDSLECNLKDRGDHFLGILIYELSDHLKPQVV